MSLQRQPRLVLLHCYWDVAGTGKFETLLNSKTYQISDRSGRRQGWAGEHMLMQGNERPLLILEQCHHQPRNKVNVATCSMLQYTVCFTSSCFRNRAAVRLFWDLWCPQSKGFFVTPRLGVNFLLVRNTPNWLNNKTGRWSAKKEKIRICW